MRHEPIDPSGKWTRGRVRPELHQLALFIAVAETRSFAATALRLGVTQSAVSQTIRRLEDIMGGNLFERRRFAALGLTPTGAAILPSARLVLDLIDREMVRAAEMADSQGGALTIGFFAGLGAGPLRSGIATFRRESPEVRLRLVEGTPSDLDAQLRSRSIDMMIVALTPDLRDARHVEEILWRERLVAALPADHPLGIRGALSWDDLAAVPLILRSWQNEMIAYHALLTRMGERPIDCEQHAVSRGALLDLVGMGLGTTILLESAVVPHARVVFRPIEEHNAFTEVKAVWAADDANPLRHRLLDQIRIRPGQADRGLPLNLLFPATPPRQTGE